MNPITIEALEKLTACIQDLLYALSKEQALQIDYTKLELDKQCQVLRSVLKEEVSPQP